MSIAAITQFVFVDFENVQTVDLSAIDGKPVHVTLLIGKNQRKLELGLVQQIHRLANRVRLVEVGASGHNALDMTLAYHLGWAARQSPRAKYHIVSKDKDFDPLIAHLGNNGISVMRTEIFAALPFLPPPVKIVAAKKIPSDRRTKVIARLMNSASPNRPSKRRALIAHIKTALGKEASDSETEAIERELLDKKVLTIDAKGAVRYAAELKATSR
jgi:hypothetical protein